MRKTDLWDRSTDAIHYTDAPSSPFYRSPDFIYCEELPSGAIRKIQHVRVDWFGDNFQFIYNNQPHTGHLYDPAWLINQASNLIIKRHQKKETTVNENIELINLLQAERGVKTCLVRTSGKTLTTFKVPPQLQLSLEDQVLVQINGNFRAGKVVGLHDEAEFDFDNPIAYDWVIQKLDLDPYNQLLDEEKTILRKLRRAAAYERLKRTVEAGGFELDKIETPLLTVTNKE